ncbi:MAG: FKBP-type peptidyl-prolyl cis-trans isomerase [Acidobacteriota bacterium]
MPRSFLPVLLSSGLLLALGSCAPPADTSSSLDSGASSPPGTEAEKTLYSLGMALSGRFQALQLSPEEVAMIQEGLGDGLLGQDPQVPLDEYRTKIDQMLKSRLADAAVREKEAGKAFLAQEGSATGAVTTETGLIYTEMEPGDGENPAATDTVKVEYVGSLRDGTLFDRSDAHGGPVAFNLGNVVPCFRQGITRMKVGGRSKLVCPPELAYGDRGIPPNIPAGATLVFQVDLVEIVKEAGGAPPGS